MDSRRAAVRGRVSFIEGSQKSMGNLLTSTLDPRLSYGKKRTATAPAKLPKETWLHPTDLLGSRWTRPIKCNGSPAIRYTMSFFRQTTTHDRSDIRLYLSDPRHAHQEGYPSTQPLVHDVLRVVWKFRHKISYLEPGTWLQFDEPSATRRHRDPRLLSLPATSNRIANRASRPHRRLYTNFQCSIRGLEAERLTRWCGNEQPFLYQDMRIVQYVQG